MPLSKLKYLSYFFSWYNILGVGFMKIIYMHHAERNIGNNHNNPELRQLEDITDIGIQEAELLSKRLEKQNNREKHVINDYEKLQIENRYIKLLYMVVAISSFLALFVWPLFLVQKYIGIIYSVCLFVVAISTISVLQQIRKEKLFS